MQESKLYLAPEWDCKKEGIEKVIHVIIALVLQANVPSWFAGSIMTVNLAKLFAGVFFLKTNLWGN